MALKKTLTHPATGLTGSYARLSRIAVDYTVSEATAVFALYADAGRAKTAGARPIIPVLAKLRLGPDEFVARLSAEALASSALTTDPVRSALYRAARELPLISDLGPNPFAGAEDA